nr:hypothetical protein [Tanacetum cinerariifolium]
MESDEVTESNAENLLPIPSKCEVTSEDEIECDMPANDDCSPIFNTFSNPLFKNDDLDSSDDESLPDEDVPAEDFKIYSNPLFDEDEINFDKLDPHCFNVESDFVESLLNRDTFIDYSSKFDFSGELAHVNPKILKSDFDFEEEIRLIENLLYDNSSPRPSEELNAEIADTIVESIPSLLIPVQDADLFLSDNSIPPGIENVADDPEGDIRFLEELLIDDSILSHESSDSNFEDNPLIPRPPLEPPDAETYAGEEIPVVMNEKDEDVDYSSFIFVIYPEMFPLLLSAESEDTIFDPGILFSSKMRMTTGEHIALEIQFNLTVELLLEEKLGSWCISLFTIFILVIMLLIPRLGSTTLACKVIVTLNEFKAVMRELCYKVTPKNRHAFYKNGDDDDVDYTIAITPVLSTEETDNSLSMGDEHLDTISATESDEVIKSSVEDLVPIPSESEGIPDTMCDVHLVNNHTPLEAKDHFKIVISSNDDISYNDDDSLYNENIEYVEASPHDSELVSLEVAEIIIPEEEEIEDDNLREKLLNVHLLIANIEALKDNHTPSSEFLTKSSSTSPKSFLEETSTFQNSLPEFENFYIDLEEISNGNTTTDSDISLSDYEAFSFNNDHIKEISSGSTTTHSDISLSEYDSFIFDFTHEEFTDELAHIISPPEYDCFYFWDFPDPGELMSVLNSRIRENLSSTTRVNLPVEDDYSPLLAYVVWIFLAYLTYPIIPPYLHPFGNEDTIFDPGITINRFCLFTHGLSHRCGAFKKFNTHRSHLNECPMIINGKNTSILVVLLFHFYPP